MTAPVPRCEGWLAVGSQALSVSHSSHTQSLLNPTPIASQAGGLVGYVLATTAPRCLDMVGAVMLLRCQQAMSLSGVSTPSWCCVGGRRLARHLTARGHLDSSRGCLCGRRRRSLGKSCNRGGDILPEAQRSRISGNLVHVEYGHQQPFWALVLSSGASGRRLGANGSGAIDVVSPVVTLMEPGAFRSPREERSTCHRRAKKLGCFRCRCGHPCILMPTIAFGTAGVDGAYGEISPLAL